MAASLAQLRVEPVEQLPETASICHYDELEESVQLAIIAAQQQGRTTIDVETLPAALVDLCDCEIVKYTEYYRVNRV